MTKPKQRWSWKKRVVVTVAVLIGLRALLALAVPWFVELGARSIGLTSKCEHAALTLTRGRLVIQGLELRERGPDGEPIGEPVVELDYLAADLAMLPLFTGEIRLQRADVDRLTVRIERNERGVIDWVDRLGLDVPSADEVEDEPAPVKLDAPISVDALRVQQAVLHLVDRAVDPAFETRLVVEARLSHLGSTTREAEFELDARADGVLERARIELAGMSADRTARARGLVRVEGVQLEALRAELANLGLAPDGKRLDARARVELTVEPARAPADPSRPANSGDGQGSRDAANSTAGAEPTAHDRAIAPHVEFSAIALEVDGVSRAHLGHARFAADAVSSELFLGVRAELAEGELALARRSDGTLAALGVRLIPEGGTGRAAESTPPPGPQGTTSASESAPSVTAAGSDRADRGNAGPAWSWGRTQLSNLAVRFLDEAVSPPLALDAVLESAELAELTARDARTRTSTLAWKARSPAMFGVVEGRCVIELEGDDARAHVEASGEALAPDALAPYLHAAGIESALRNGNWRASAGIELRRKQGGLALTGARLESFVLRDGEEELVSAALSTQGFESRDDSFVVGEVHVSRFEARVRRDAEGIVHGLGLRSIVAPRAGVPAKVEPSTPRGSAAFERIPRVELGGLHVEGVRLALRDESVEPALVVPDLEVTFALGSLVLGGAVATGKESVAKLRGKLQAAPLLAEAALDGSIRARTGPLDLDARVELSIAGLDARPLATHLAPYGVTPLLAAGRGASTVEFAARAKSAGLEVDAKLANVWFGEGERRHVSLPEASLAGRLADDGWKGTSISARVDELQLGRARDGALRAFGVELRPTVTPQVPEPRVPPAELLARALDLPRLALGKASVSLKATWRDEALAAPTVQPFTLDARIDDLVVGPGAPTTAWEILATMPGAVAVSRMHGTLRADPADLACAFELDVRGVDGARLDAYLPSTIRCELAGGSITARGELALVRSGPRSWSAWSAMRDVRLTLAPDDGMIEPELTLKGAELDLQLTLDEAGELASAKIARCVTRGLGATARFDVEGALHAAGLVVGAAKAATQPEAPQLPSGERAPTPRIEVVDLALELQRLRIVDDRRGGVPLDVALAFEGRGSQTLLAPDPAALAPIEFSLRGRFEPLARELVVDISAEPWAVAPKLVIDAEVRGVRGAGLVELLPELAATVDGAGLVDGRLRARLSAEAKLTRSRADELDFSRPFGATVRLEGLEFRAEPSGEPLAGIDSIAAAIDRIDPRTGDVRVKSIEVARPFARLSRDAEGFEFLGLRVRLASASAESDPIPDPIPETIPSPPAEPSVPGGVVSVDRFEVHGLDVRFVDETSSPAVVLPLTNLEIDVRRFSTRAFVEPLPIAFHARLESGLVALPKRERSSSVLAGVLGAAGRAVTGRDDESVLEERPLFDEVVLGGRIVLTPKPTGWIALDVSALELAPLSSFATDQGVILGDGVVDQSLRVRLQGERGFGVEATSVFRDLRLSEGPDGPISRYLTLPAPLDTVLFLLEDAEGAQRLPVSVRVGESGIGGGELASAMAGAASTVIARAVASSPLRVLGGVGGMLGLGDEPEVGSRPATVLEFAAGDIAVPQEAEAAWGEFVLDAMPDSSRVLELAARIGSDDLERAAELANPTRADVEELCARLRHEKAELHRRGGELAAAARVHWSVDRADEARAAGDQLRELDRRLNEIEAALDRLAEHLRPGAEKRRDARTRAAALVLARERLEAAKSWMVERGLAASRIKLVRPRFELVGERGGVAMRVRTQAAK